MENSTVVPTEESPVITALTVIATFGSDNIAYLKLPVAFLGFFLNIFHLFILTRKSMRVTSINVWLIYIAVCDLIILFYAGREDVKTIWEAEKNECTPPETYLHKILSNTLFTCNRTSWILTPWLVIIMATARLLIISNPMSATFEKLSTPLFAIISSIIITLFCSITSIIMLIPVNIVKIREWIPEESCGFPSNYSQPLYGQGQDGWIPSLELIVVLLFIQGLVNVG
uniref:G_PROTEIN_RECEP_F1_2 domain-containing protein n=1 Tax=Caenorhabditis tropicalis TaxID=1561998 RepID=A0A1I7TYD9_9PELO